MVLLQDGESVERVVFGNPEKTTNGIQIWIIFGIVACTFVALVCITVLCWAASIRPIGRSKRPMPDPNDDAFILTEAERDAMERQGLTRHSAIAVQNRIRSNASASSISLSSESSL